ncbi:hypothetical protein EI94DRAFT_1711689, partial [Lactarius quietus]
MRGGHTKWESQKHKRKGTERGENGERRQAWEKEDDAVNDKGKGKDKARGLTSRDQEGANSTKQKGKGSASTGDGPNFSGFEQTRIQEKVREALLGIVAMNLHTPPEGTYWGRFNDRPLSKAVVSELVAGFHKMVNNSTDQTAVDMVVKKGWLLDAKSFHQTVEGMSIHQVTELRLSEAGLAEIKNDNLWMLGGHHRHQALQIYVKEKEQVIAEAKKKLVASTQGKGDEDGEGERQDLEEKIAKEEGELAAGKKWAVRVYDQEVIEANSPEMANTIFRFISRNEVKASMRAMPEERMLEVVNELRDAFEKDETETKEENSKRGADEAITINSNFMKALDRKVVELTGDKELRHLCTTTAFAQGLVMASRIRRQYTHAEWFKVTTLNTMLETHGA